MKMKLIEIYKLKSTNERRIINAFVSFCCGLIWAIIQFVIFLITKSFFLFSSSLFSLSLSLARLLSIIGYKKEENDKDKSYLVLSSIFIITGGIFYSSYSLRLLFGETPTDFGLIPSITIALFSFIFIINSITTLIKDRKNKNKYIKNIKIISFITSLVNIMLTQMSLLMVQSPNMDQKYNLYFALIIGAIAIILGIYSLISGLINKVKNNI